MSDPAPSYAAVKVVDGRFFGNVEFDEYAGVTYLSVPVDEDRAALAEAGVIEIWFGDAFQVVPTAQTDAKVAALLSTPGRQARLFHEEGMSRYVQVEWLDGESDTSAQDSSAESETAGATHG